MPAHGAVQRVGSGLGLLKEQSVGQKHSKNILGTFREHSENIQGTYREVVPAHGAVQGAEGRLGLLKEQGVRQDHAQQLRLRGSGAHST